MSKTDEFGLFIMGGGPGDPELITIRAYKVLQRADVVLYDNLVNKDLLELVPPVCELIYVGKQPYGAYTTQERIHELILEHCAPDKTVIRLKGGDPYIFGRGYEELLFAEEHGIKTYYIPGITSMQSAGMNDIPLTHRGVSESIWIITGTKKDGSLSRDLQSAINSAATVVIYMGMKKLGEIAQTYISAELGDMPAAIIQHGTLSNQKKVICLAKDLESAAAQGGLTYPAMIIIGPVVNIKGLNIPTF
jgi:uroporphyrin-III C-methyltransferase